VSSNPWTRWAIAPISPNPVARAGRVSFEVPRSAELRLTLLDLQGREVATLAHGRYEPGRFSAPVENPAAGLWGVFPPPRVRRGEPAAQADRGSVSGGRARHVACRVIASAT